MVTYEFYKDIYLGSAISKAAFPELAARAEDYLARLERSCQVVSGGPESRGMALCAVAETMDAWGRKRPVKQETVGGVSITYLEDGRASLGRQLWQSACTYLDIHRGVK